MTSSTISISAGSDTARPQDRVLNEIQHRVLWLATQMVHHANKGRANPDGVKVGGHQASSASVVTIMTFLFFEYLKSGDKISVKPHASPVYHAIQFLLGNLEPHYLKSLRAFQGLQSYPSRTKDPDPVDFSTGSMGLGAVAPNFSAMVDEYIACHFGRPDGPCRRFVSLVGDAELDEGAVWEAIAEPALIGADNLLWVVDINRQSLDRVIPGIRVQCWRDMFRANGWQVIDAKYGKRLQAAFEMPDGHLLRKVIDELSNEAYQRLLRSPASQLREWLPKKSDCPGDLQKLLGQWNDEELHDLFGNLGGHDLNELRDAFGKADRGNGPKVIFAYTLKGWMLPLVGHPQNHSLHLTENQMEEFRCKQEISKEDIWAGFEPESEAGRLCLEAAGRLHVESGVKPPESDLMVPQNLQGGYAGSLSTQQIFGSILTGIARALPELAERIVTVSPDVASSTNLGGWIAKMDVWSRMAKEVLPEETEPGAIKWRETTQGRHIELGISENNLFMALGQFGLSSELLGELLYPIGTLYDCFVSRGLDAFYYGVYSGAKFIVVGTPSGITLAPEGGAHQSLITGSIGIELPGVAFFEPCFGQELEWILMSGLENIRTRTESTFLRLTSKRVDQNLLIVPEDVTARERLRQQVIKGAYRLIDRSGEAGYAPGVNVVHIFTSGALVPEAITASRQLQEKGIFANVFNVTGPGPLYHDFQRSVHQAISGTAAPASFLAEIVRPGERPAPVVTVVDGHPHSLAWIGGALGTQTFPLGVVDFGQSGTCADLYREYKIDAGSIAATCLEALRDGCASKL